MIEPTRAADQFIRLLEIMRTLRGPDGCPWDREQTIDSLKPFVLEETYEVLDAIDRHDHGALCEELGDFLFEAIFLAQLEEEAGRFGIADSLAAVADKLVRRHPHVFARQDDRDRLHSADQVRARWDEIKAREKAARAGAAPDRHTLLGGIAPTLPALLRAHHIGIRAASVGFDWSGASDVVEKIQEEVDELRQVASDRPADRDRLEEELGDLLLAIANLARKLDVEPETALRKANDKFTRRFSEMERAADRAGRTVGEMSPQELEREWQSAKAKEAR
jgi:MazG family protein